MSLNECFVLQVWTQRQRANYFWLRINTYVLRDAKCHTQRYTMKDCHNTDSTFVPISLVTCFGFKYLIAIIVSLTIDTTIIFLFKKFLLKYFECMIIDVVKQLNFTNYLQSLIAVHGVKQSRFLSQISYLLYDWMAYLLTLVC